MTEWFWVEERFSATLLCKVVKGQTTTDEVVELMEGTEAMEVAETGGMGVVDTVAVTTGTGTMIGIETMIGVGTGAMTGSVTGMMTEAVAGVGAGVLTGAGAEAEIEVLAGVAVEAGVGVRVLLMRVVPAGALRAAGAAVHHPGETKVVPLGVTHQLAHQCDDDSILTEPQQS